MSVSICITNIKKFATDNGIKLDPRTVEYLAKKIDAIGLENFSKAEIGSKIQQIVDENIKANNMKMVAANAQTLATREAAFRTITTNIKDFGLNAFASMKGFINGGEYRPNVGLNRGIPVMEHSYKSRLQGFYHNAVLPFKDLMQSGKIDKEILMELSAIQNGEPRGISKSLPALKIAEAIHATQQKIFNLKKSFNPLMETIQDYLVKQTHSREKISATEKDSWIKDALVTYGKKSFTTLSSEEKDKAFGVIYDRIKDGNYGSIIDDSNSDKFITASGMGGNIQKAMARERSLIAESPELQYAYAQKYGKGTVGEIVQHTIDRSSKDIALLEKFGPNIRGGYEGMVRRIANSIEDPAEKEAFLNSKGKLDKEFRTAIGDSDAPARSGLARWYQGLSAIEYMSKLGNSTIRATTDIAVSSGLMRTLNGKNLFQNAYELTGKVIKNLASPAEAKKTLDNLYMFTEHANRNFLRDIGGAGVAQTGVLGAIGKMTELYGPLTLMSRWNNAMRAAAGDTIGHLLADMADKGFHELTPQVRENFGRYNIGEHEWEFLRRGVEDWGKAGRDGYEVNVKSLNADGVEQIPHEFTENYLRKSGKLVGNTTPEILDHARWKLSSSLGAMINDFADISSSTANNRQKSFLLGGHDINSTEGLVRRAVTQFKGANLSNFDAYRRMYFSGGDKGGVSTVAQSMALATTIYMMGQAAIDMANGKTPENFNPLENPGYAAKSLVGAGAFALYGDYMSSAAFGSKTGDRFNDLAKTALGPILSDATQAASIVAQSAYTRNPDTGSAKKLVRSLIPFGNLPGVKGALDYGVNSAFGEQRQLQKLQENTEKNGQQYLFFKPTGKGILGTE